MLSTCWVTPSRLTGTGSNRPSARRRRRAGSASRAAAAPCRCARSIRSAAANSSSWPGWATSWRAACRRRRAPPRRTGRAGVVPVAHDAGAVAAVDGDVGRQFDRGDEAVQQIERGQSRSFRSSPGARPCISSSTGRSLFMLSPPIGTDHFCPDPSGLPLVRSQTSVPAACFALSKFTLHRICAFRRRRSPAGRTPLATPLLCFSIVPPCASRSISPRRSTSAPMTAAVTRNNRITITPDTTIRSVSTYTHTRSRPPTTQPARPTSEHVLPIRNLRFIGLFCIPAAGIHFLSHSDGSRSCVFL